MEDIEYLNAHLRSLLRKRQGREGIIQFLCDCLAQDVGILMGLGRIDPRRDLKVKINPDRKP